MNGSSDIHISLIPTKVHFKKMNYLFLSVQCSAVELNCPTPFVQRLVVCVGEDNSFLVKVSSLVLPMSTSKPNKDLTTEERKAKQDLKNELRHQQKRQKLETRLRHARVRRDTVIEQTTQQELNQLESVEYKEDLPNEEARTFVMQLAQALQRKQPHHGSTTHRHVQKEQARRLLKHMTKGTQKKKMFDNEDALWGYTRHKFIERALLVCDSFSKVQQLESSRKVHIWNTLLETKTVCSIGCGPGNDALGVLAFLRNHLNATATLHQVICLDYVMAEWQIVLKPLQEILVGSNYIDTLSLEFCDVTHSLLESLNDQAKRLLTNPSHEVNVFLFSYLLTETRGKWEPFLRDIIQLAQPGALFYFAEPSPWQLHLVTRMEQLDVEWLDSSMNQPKMQAINRRFGPAVLLGQKKVEMDGSATDTTPTDSNLFPCHLDK